MGGLHTGDGGAGADRGAGAGPGGRRTGAPERSADRGGLGVSRCAPAAARPDPRARGRALYSGAADGRGSAQPAGARTSPTSVVGIGVDGALDVVEQQVGDLHLDHFDLGDVLQRREIGRASCRERV